MSSIWLGIMGWTSAARAEGPWALTRGQTSLWLSNEITRWDTIAGADGEQIALGTGVWRASSQLIVKRGLFDALELQGLFGYASSWVGDPTVSGCAMLGAGACEATSAPSPFEFRVQNRLAEQRRARAPGSAAWGSTLRVGNASAPDRGKVTGIGEGTTDLAAYFTGGRQDALGRAQVRTSATLLGRLRPGLGAARVGVAPELDARLHSELSGGPLTARGALHLLHRGGGLHLSATDLTAPDRFTDLSVSSLDAEIGLLARAKHLSVGLTAASPLWVRDNPSDRLYLGLGIGAWLPEKSKQRR